MDQFALALAAFVLLHVGVSASGLRAVLVTRMGEWPYRGAFSVASIALLVWLIVAYAAVKDNPANPLNAPIWFPTPAAHWAGIVLVALGFLLAIPSYFGRSPTMVGMEKALQAETPAKGVLRITRHPFLWGVALWAAGHLLANGERSALMLFGALGLMVLLGARSIDRKTQARDPEHWARFAAVTSNIPFAAIFTGRNRLVLGEMWLGLLVAVAVIVLTAYIHAILGAPVLPSFA